MLMRQDQPVHMPRRIVEDAVEQDLPRVGRRRRIPQRVQHLRNQLPVLAWSGNRDPLTAQRLAVAQQCLEQPVAVGLVKARVKDKLHVFSMVSLSGRSIRPLAPMETVFERRLQFANFPQIGSCTAARHSVITPPEPL